MVFVDGEILRGDLIAPVSAQGIDRAGHDDLLDAVDSAPMQATSHSECNGELCDTDHALYVARCRSEFLLIDLEPV